MAERLINAGFNTLIGISIVFAVLILISFIISLFKYIPAIMGFFSKIKKAIAGLFKRNKKNSAIISIEAVDKTIEQIVHKEEHSNDLELVAVITAAICAATGQSADSFIVRSVRKVGRKG